MARSRSRGRHHGGRRGGGGNDRHCRSNRERSPSQSRGKRERQSRSHGRGPHRRGSEAPRSPLPTQRHRRGATAPPTSGGRASGGRSGGPAPRSEGGGSESSEHPLRREQRVLKEEAQRKRSRSRRPSSSPDSAGKAAVDDKNEMQKKRGDEEILEQLEELPVQLEGAEESKWGGPLLSWEDAEKRKVLCPELVAALKREGLKRPTQVQRHVLPLILHKGHSFDVVTSAETGSGKTFAFLIPIVQQLFQSGDMSMMRPFFPGSSAQASPLALIASPTRELAIQTDKELQLLLKGTKFRSACVYGGVPLKVQEKMLMDKQTDVLCGTPGRILDLVDANRLSLSFMQTVVIDEADQMLEQHGLERVLNELLNDRDCPDKQNRQTLLFSATFAPAIQDICKKTLREAPHYAFVRVGHYDNEKGGSVKNIKQQVIWAPDDNMRMQFFCRAIADIHSKRVREAQKNGASSQALTCEVARADVIAASNALAGAKPGSQDYQRAAQDAQVAARRAAEAENELRKAAEKAGAPPLPEKRTDINSLGMPLKPGAKPCEFFMKSGRCDYGMKCVWDHPERPDPSKPIGGGVKPCRVVVFSNRRIQAEAACGMLRGRGFYADHLHGKMEQWQREEVVDNFKKTDFGVLIATNVASRGLDFDDTAYVFQLDVPPSGGERGAPPGIDVYTHRIGRTGRIGNEGTAVAFMGPKDAKLAGPLVDLLRLNEQEVPGWLDEMAQAQAAPPASSVWQWQQAPKRW